VSRFSVVNVLLFLAVIVLVAVPLVFVSGEFAGSDDQGQRQIEKSNPGYKPWFSSIYEPPSSEVSSGLFAIQAAIGGGALGYYFGVARTRRRLAGASPTEAPSSSAVLPTGNRGNARRADIADPSAGTSGAGGSKHG
jgi:cobalt/nickel transport protein